MSTPDITEEDVQVPGIGHSTGQAVAEVVRSGRLALGPKTEEFERSMAEYVGVKHAIAVSSGTTGVWGQTFIFESPPRWHVPQ
jgi:perosamine synthetase